MATYTQRGDSWRVEVRRRGHKSIRRTFDTKAQGEQWALETEAELLGKGTASDGSYTLRDAFIRYALDVTPKKKGARWEALRLEKMARELDFIGKRLNDITSDDVGRWRDQRLKTKYRGKLVGRGSVLREMVVLSGVFNVARKEWKWCRQNPVRDAAKPKKPKHRRRRVSEAEIDALKATIGYDATQPPARLIDEILVMFLLAIETAMRSGELLRLRWPTVYLKKRYAHLPDSKNDDARDVPLSREAVRLLELMEDLHAPEVFAVDNATRDAEWRKYRDKAGIVDLTFHDSRHEAISRLAQKLHVLDLAKMVGVRNPKTLMIYYDREAAEVAKLLD
jgi:integrase